MRFASLVWIDTCPPNIQRRLSNPVWNVICVSHIMRTIWKHWRHISVVVVESLMCRQNVRVCRRTFVTKFVSPPFHLNVLPVTKFNYLLFCKCIPAIVCGLTLNIISVKIEFKSARVFGRYFLKTFPDTPRCQLFILRLYSVLQQLFCGNSIQQCKLCELCINLLPFMVTV